MAFRIRPAAKADIRATYRTIAADDPAAARRWVERIEERCSRLAEMPGMGVARPDVRPGLRLWPVGNYLVLYQQVGDHVEIVRVLHVARNWPDLL